MPKHNPVFVTLGALASVLLSVALLAGCGQQPSGSQPSDVNAPAPTIKSLVATTQLGSTVRVAWTATDATAFDIYAVPSVGSQDQKLIQANVAASPVSVPIPASDRQVVRVVAKGTGGTASADVALTNVVTSAEDYDPYDLQGFQPETPIHGTLRYVLLHAATGSVIGFASDISAIDLPGVDLYDDPQPGGGTVKVDAHLILRKDVTISGPSGGIVLTGVSGAPAGTASDPFTWESRVLFVAPGVTATLDHLTIQGGEFIYSGAGIRNEGTLTVTSSTITGNRAWYEGGGIWNAAGASLTLSGSHLDGNRAVVADSERNRDFVIRGIDPLNPIHVSDGGYGGAVFNQAGATVTVSDTTFDGNEAKISGGALYNEGGTMTLTGSPVTNNSADYTAYQHEPGAYSYGGGAYSDGTFSFAHADFLDNISADLGGGFALAQAGTASLDTVFFDGNTAAFGGGIYHQYCTDPSNLEENDVTYDINTATDDYATSDIAEDDACLLPPPPGPSMQSVPAKPFPDPATLR